MKILSTPRREQCIGCHSCSLACARLVYKQPSWDKAGIQGSLGFLKDSGCRVGPGRTTNNKAKKVVLVP